MGQSILRQAQVQKTYINCVFVVLLNALLHFQSPFLFVSDYVSPKKGCDTDIQSVIKVKVIKIKALAVKSLFVNVCPETVANRNYLESKISCGIPNMDIVDEQEADDRETGRRYKRVVGGIPSKPVR